MISTSKAVRTKEIVIQKKDLQIDGGGQLLRQNLWGEGGAAAHPDLNVGLQEMTSTILIHLLFNFKENYLFGG